MQSPYMIPFRMTKKFWYAVEGMTLTFAFPITTTPYCHPERAPVETHIDTQPSEGSYGV